MITVLLQKIIDMLTDHFPAVITLLSKLNLIEEDTEEMRGNLDSMKTTLEDVDTQATAAAGKLTTIDTTLTATAGNVASIKNNSDAIKNNIITMSTNVGNVAAYTQDTANNTLDIDQKITSIASDTTDIRTSNDDIYAESSKIYDAVKWLLSDKDMEETETGENSVSFDTDYAEDLVKLDVGLTATQSGTGTPAPDNVRIISGYLNANITANGTLITINLGGTTYYGGVLDVINGILTVTHKILLNLGNYNYVYISSNSCFRTSSFMSDYKHTTSGILAKSMCDSYMNNTLANVLNVNGSDNSYAFGTSGLYNNSLVIRNNSITDPAVLKSSLNNVQLVYELETPITVSLTPQQIATIKGLNTISTDTNGEITVTYKESIKHYLDKND